MQFFCKYKIISKWTNFLSITFSLGKNSNNVEIFKLKSEEENKENVPSLHKLSQETEEEKTLLPSLFSYQNQKKKLQENCEPISLLI